MATFDKNFKVKNGLDVASRINTAASTTSSASINIPHGTAPTSPTNGDVWTTTDGMYVRINGSTVGPFSSGSASGITVSDTAPSSPQVGDLWFNSIATRTFIYYDSYWVEASSPVAAVGLFDGGLSDSTYGGIAPIDAGGVA